MRTRAALQERRGTRSTSWLPPGRIALFLLIVLSPIVLLLVLLWLAFRARSRRVEARLLDRPDPASPPSA